MLLSGADPETTASSRQQHSGGCALPQHQQAPKMGQEQPLLPENHIPRQHLPCGSGSTSKSSGGMGSHTQLQRSVEAAPLQLRLFSSMVDAVLSYGSEV
jgi:hypothetical protein